MSKDKIFESHDEVPKVSKKSRKKKVNNVYRNLISSLFLYLKIPNILSSSNEDNSIGDLEAIECDLSGHTIVNKCFKKSSCVQKVTPLTYESIKKSLLKEMKNCSGKLKLLYDISKDETEETSLRNELEGLTNEEINVALLWSAFYKKSHILRELLKLGANFHYSEPSHGLTALHLAVFSGCADTTRFLLEQNINVNVINKWYSPLHCAALAKQSETARLLLDYGARVDSMTNGPGYETPLYLAVKVNAIECVRLFVERGAQIYQEGKLADMSPLFLAAELGHAECLRLILDVVTIDCDLMRQLENGNAALHLAAEYGRSECIEVLLEYDADPNVTNLRSQTPLHLAVKANSYTSVVILIKNGRTDLNMKDFNKRTPLHEAIELVADSRRDIVKVLLENGADVNASDQHGLTPLHVAALNELADCVVLLIDQDADYSAKSKSGVSAFSLIAKKTPRVMHRIREKFNDFISLEHNSESLKQVEMRMDFRNGLHHPKEYDFLNSFIDAGHKEMLLHPFCRAFLYVTWGRVRRCFYGIILNTALYSFILMGYILTALAYDCERNINMSSVTNSSVYCNNDSYFNQLLKNNPITLEIQWYLLVFVTIPIVYRKLYGIRGYPSLKAYFGNLRNICDWQCVVYVLITSFLYTGNVEIWQLYVGAFALLCSWSTTMNLLGQLPVFGPYVEMLHKVMSEFFKLLLVYFLLLLGFSTSFCVFFPNSSAFSNPLIGIISTLVLMTGDMNYDLLLGYVENESPKPLVEVGALIIYVLFAFFVTIILMNLLMGLAIQDIEVLQKTADLTRLVRQAKVSSYIEIANENNGQIVKYVMTFLKIFPKLYMGVLKCKPLDPDEDALPKVILQDAYDLAKKRREKVEMAHEERTVQWKALWNRSVKQKVTEWKKNDFLEQLIRKVDRHKDQVAKLRAEIDELKEITAH